MRKIGAVVKNMELQRRNYKKHNQPISINYTQTNSDAGYQLTDEQKLCVEASCRGANLKIKAFAGSGKTSTLVEIAKNLSGRGLYLAYNKVIQLDAVKKFPEHIDCKTAHSFAYGANAYRIKGRVRNLNVFDILEYIEIKQKHTCEESDIAFLTLKLLRVFANSDKQKIDNYFSTSSVFDTVEGNDNKETKAIINYVINRAAEYWMQCIEKASMLPIEHDFYLKMYQLSQPNLSNAYDFILFDECQDANPVLLDILSRQTCQKIYVGDEHQQIYSWRGSINAFAKLEGEEYYLSQSFRFGEGLSKLANIITLAKGEKKLLRGFPAVETSIAQKSIDFPFTVLCRTNARIIEVILKFRSKRLHVVGGVVEVLNLAKSGYALFTDDISNVKHLKLKQFKSWNAMLHFNHKYQDPDITFLAKLIKEHDHGFKSVISQIDNANYVAEDIADITLSTIHKSKGREWNNVVVEDDFMIFGAGGTIEEILINDTEELNLIYVAVTRVKRSLLLAKGVNVFIERLISHNEKQRQRAEYEILPQRNIDVLAYEQCARA